MTTQEDKELLLRDLCAKLPYGVKINENTQGDFTVIGLTMERVFTTCEVEGCHNDFPIECIKPYLFPLSSMTEEERKEFLSVAGYERREEDCGRHTETYYYDMVGHEHNLHPNSDAIDWLNKNHFDYRGLIEKGLAIDATGLNIY